MRRNGTRHFKLRATQQMGRSCVFQVEPSCQQPPPRGTITRGASARSRAAATTMPQLSAGTAQPISTTPLSPAEAAADTASASRHTNQPSLASAPFSATRNARGVNGGSSGTTTTPRVARRAITAGDWSSSKLRSTRSAELMRRVCRPHAGGNALQKTLDPENRICDPSAALHEALNGVSHSVASCALQLGHSCGFQGTKWVASKEN